jgi:hypothetical protein
MKLSDYFSNNRRLLIIITAFLLLTFLVVFGWWFINRLKEPVVPAIKCIPTNIAWYIEFKSATDLWERENKSNDIINEIRNFPYFNSILSNISFLDSIAKNNESAASLIAGQPIYICCRYDKKNNPEYLYLMNLPDAHQTETVHDIIKNSLGDKINITEKEDGHYLLFTGLMNNGNTFTFTIEKGVFIFSSQPDFVMAALEQMNSGHSISEDPDYSKISATSGKNVDANFYINLKQLGNCIDKYTDPSQNGFEKFLSSMGSWAGLDLIIKKDEVLLNGYANCKPGDYLEIFGKQKPQKNDITGFIPFNTAVMLFFGLDDITKFSEDNQGFLEDKDIKTYNIIAQINKKCNCDIRQTMLSWMGHEAAMVITESPAADFRANSYGVFRIANENKARNSLESISTQTENLDLPQEDEHNLSIRQIPIPELLPALFGKAFNYITGNYYLILDNYVVFGNSPQSLHVFASAYFSGKTLNKNENYSAFAENVSDHASICLYVNIRKSLELIKSFTEKKFRADLDQLTPRLRNFQAFAIQVSSENTLFYVTLYLKYNPSYKDENPAIWEVKLDTNIATDPVLIFDKLDSTGYVWVSDVSNQIYLIDCLGRIVWKQKLSEPVFGKAQITDRYKNGGCQIVFNTMHQIFMIGLDGKNLPGFPANLKYPATNPLTVVDFDANKNYQLILACDDHKLYNINSSGKPAAGWNSPLVGALVQEPVFPLMMSGKHYIIATDGNGLSHFYDRKGKSSFLSPEIEFIKSVKSGYFVYPDGVNSKIITTDRKGRIIRTGSDGKWESVTLQTFSPDHSFLYDDFDGNGNNDFIFADSGKIVVYNVNNKNIFNLTIPGKITFGPERISVIKDQPMFAIVCSEQNKVLLFSKSGLSPINQYLIGNTSFCSGKLDKSGICSLIIGKNNMVYNYYLTGF